MGKVEDMLQIFWKELKKEDPDRDEDEEEMEMVEFEEWLYDEAWLGKQFEDDGTRFKPGGWLDDVLADWGIGLNGWSESYDLDLGEDGIFYNA